MSKDIIYREDAIKAINARLNWYQVTCNGKQIAVMLMAKDVNEILEKVPSADRPQGEWIDIEPRLNRRRVNKFKRCSHCGFSWARPFDDNYCPNCGVRMKGAEDER